MHFLIDGYNLLFALGLAGGRSGPKALARARADLLDWLHRAHGPQITQVTVVFDGMHAPSDKNAVQIDRGLNIRFSVGETADDLLEEIIRREVNPQKLTVISSDHRIQAAAKRRNCNVWDSAEYIDWALDQGHPPPPQLRPPAKPATPTAAETARWLEEFGHVDDDPELKKFNRPFEDFRDSD